MKVVQKIKSFFKRGQGKAKAEPKPESQPAEKKSRRPGVSKEPKIRLGPANFSFASDGS